MGLKDSQALQLCQIANEVWVGVLNWILYLFFREITVCARRTKLTSSRCRKKPQILEKFLTSWCLFKNILWWDNQSSIKVWNFPSSLNFRTAFPLFHFFLPASTQSFISLFHSLHTLSKGKD